MSWRKLRKQERNIMKAGFDFINTNKGTAAGFLTLFLVPDFSHIFFAGQEKEGVHWRFVLVMQVSVLRDV